MEMQAYMYTIMYSEISFQIIIFVLLLTLKFQSNNGRKTKVT